MMVNVLLFFSGLCEGISLSILICYILGKVRSTEIWLATAFGSASFCLYLLSYAGDKQ